MNKKFEDQKAIMIKIVKEQHVRDNLNNFVVSEGDFLSKMEIQQDKVINSLKETLTKMQKRDGVHCVYKG